MSNKKWEVELTRPLQAEGPAGLLIEVDAGHYWLRELDDEVTYLITDGHTTVRVRVREIIRARNAGALVINGRWP